MVDRVLFSGESRVFVYGDISGWRFLCEGCIWVAGKGDIWQNERTREGLEVNKKGRQKGKGKGESSY